MSAYEEQLGIARSLFRPELVEEMIERAEYNAAGLGPHYLAKSIRRSIEKACAAGFDWHLPRTLRRAT